MNSRPDHRSRERVQCPDVPRGRAAERLLPANRGRGFTMIELILILILVGILAVVALPRLGERSPYDARGFTDGVASALRYAQKAAIAQHREVCVAFGAASVTFTVAAAYSAGATGVCANALTGPTGGAPYTVAATGSAAFSAVPANFSFLPSGGTSLGANATLTVTGSSQTIAIDAVTGYVY